MKEYIVTEHPDFPYEEPKPQELIRCKDCKWYEKDFGCDWGVCFHNDWTVGSVGNGVDSDGYCYRAERKDNG